MTMDEAARLIPYLYTADAREAGSRLVVLGAAAVEPLIAVLNGQQAIPDLSPLDLPPPLRGAAPEADAAKERAAYLLGEIGDRRAVEPLIAAFARETDQYIRLAAVRALGMIGDPRAVDTLIAALEIPPWSPDYCALVDDLARIGGARAVEPLIRVLRSPHYTYGGAARAARALLAWRSDPRVLDGLIAALRLDAELSTVDALIAALVELGDPRGARALLALIGVMVRLPPERWDDRDDNLSETDQGVTFHVLKRQFRRAVAAVRQIGDAAALAALDGILKDAPSYISEG